jgi:hypothetical protein
MEEQRGHFVVSLYNNGTEEGEDTKKGGATCVRFSLPCSLYPVLSSQYRKGVKDDVICHTDDLSEFFRKDTQKFVESICIINFTCTYEEMENKYGDTEYWKDEQTRKRIRELHESTREKRAVYKDGCPKDVIFFMRADFWEK